MGVLHTLLNDGFGGFSLISYFTLVDVCFGLGTHEVIQGHLLWCFELP